MAGPPSYPDTGVSDHGSGPPPGPRTRWLRWRAPVIVAIALLAVMVVLHLTGTLGAGTHG
jgi:hypothetical protein